MVAVTSSAHYFSADPGTPERRRTISVELAGRQVRVQTANGVFSPEGIDKGTGALLSVVPQPPAEGSFLDVGAGWGPIALSMALQSPAATVTAVEVNERSLALCRDNAAAVGADNVTAVRPEEVAEDAGFDLIWSNPPIRIGKPALHALLQRWLPALNPGGQAWLVVQKNLGADSLLPWIRTMLQQRAPSEFTAERADSVKGFRILKVSRKS
ncbi:methyltransferase [Micrococcus lylae]|uniref:class I SAM-dependent methyltransferase n=1 Tax=Micrococcus lylae TaxID=1273 RepID=UPI0021A2C945|nr:methyltransferase [Micrococcus lylae]MCT2007068.1 methyltransferase [Micrococcus lylae]MCT2070866.1 methyltransferase [Micrococcus lylae]